MRQRCMLGIHIAMHKRMLRVARILIEFDKNRILTSITMQPSTPNGNREALVILHWCRHHCILLL